MGFTLGYFGATFGSLRGQFQGTWGHFSLTRMTLDHFGRTLGQLLKYESQFSKNTHFPMDFNDFMKDWGRIRVTWGHFGITLESL